MFELEKSVDQWCRATASRCSDSDRIAELKDHVHSQIELLQGNGLSAEEAFLEATRQFGEQIALQREFAKNQNMIERLCAFEASIANRRKVSRKTTRRLAVAHALLFAGAMLISSALLTGRDDNVAATMLYILIALWFSTQLFIPGMYGSSTSEWACMKRRFKRWIS